MRLRGGSRVLEGIPGHRLPLKLLYGIFLVEPRSDIEARVAGGVVNTAGCFDASTLRRFDASTLRRRGKPGEVEGRTIGGTTKERAESRLDPGIWRDPVRWWLNQVGRVVGKAGGGCGRESGLVGPVGPVAASRGSSEEKKSVGPIELTGGSAELGGGTLYFRTVVVPVVGGGEDHRGREESGTRFRNIYFPLATVGFRVQKVKPPSSSRTTVAKYLWAVVENIGGGTLRDRVVHERHWSKRKSAPICTYERFECGPRCFHPPLGPVLFSSDRVRRSSAEGEGEERAEARSNAKMLPKKEGVKKEPYALEDMISDLQTRRNSLDHDEMVQDPIELLKQRERDLVLAAELGKALLERNQELTKQSESLAEEYSAKLESLEQERHLLRRRLEEVRSESEAKTLELQGDVEMLRSQLEEQNERARRAERDQATLVAELTAQNTRLADQLRETAKQEEQLFVEVKVLREKCALRNSTLQDHVSSLEILRDEVQLVSAQRTELERRSLELREERARALAALEEAEERAAALDRLSHEAEHRARMAERERDELAAALASIEAERRGRSGSIQRPPRSLQAEMECEESGSSLGEQEDLRTEVTRAVKRLKELCAHLRRGEDDSGLQSDCDESMLVIVNNGTEQEPNCPGALLDLVEDVYNLALSGRGAPGELGLAVELHRVREELEHTKEQLRQTQDELKRRGEALLDTTSKLSVCEAELRGAREERDRARRDIEHSQLTKDEILAQAYQVRDQAVARKNRAEVELARTRIDVLQANSQLMEAIQQKVELSQQLEQWQMDVQSLLDEHVRSKLTPATGAIPVMNGNSSEIVAPARKKRSTGSSKKMFGLF
ncbi:hypothetical protein KM043_000773 [Ampulex compressa]|nr:hypothetical protein KM043_000773 [Ampulex compressa]